MTDTSKEALEWLPLASVAVHVTVVVPTGKTDPEAGLQATDGELSATSLADGASHATVVPPGSVVTIERSDGIPASDGAVVSRTVTANDPEADAPAVSVAVQETVVVPIGSSAPDVGTQVTVGSGSSWASVADASKAAVQPPVVSASTVNPSGSDSTGGVFTGAAGTATRNPTDVARDRPSAGDRPKPIEYW